VATIAELEARVPGLSLGKKYQFRVVACTKVLGTGVVGKF
jgi:hypothetical protein